MNQRWLIAPAATRPGDPLTRILAQRGVTDRDRFLRPRLQQLADPFELPDMEPAVQRLLAALDTGQRIVLYGDYDVDGVTGCALLTRVLRAAGGRVETFLPHRVDEGYGLTAEALARCRQQTRPELLIAVDCGTTARREVAALTAAGVDVIVLDHHEPPAELPACVAVVNPKRASASGAGPATPLASVGVAFKFAHALLKRRRSLAVDLREHLDLVALGTVADLVPLTGDNRIVVRAGLERLAGSRKPGVRALLEVAGLDGPIQPGHIGFRLGPRLNAAGRLADAMAALELLLTEEAGRAAELAALLEAHNAERQRIEEQAYRAALAQVRAADRVLVVADESWHAGVVGIVASRLTQQFYRPSVVIGSEGRGSCRSVAGFSMVAALRAADDLLLRHGGHEMAAGLTVLPERVPALRERLNEFASRQPGADAWGPVLRVDAVVELAEVNAELLAGLEQLEPCGVGNPTPVLATWGLRLAGEARVVGRNHLKFAVTDGVVTLPAIAWKMGERELPARLDLAYTPQWNEFREAVTIQLEVRDWRAAAGAVGGAGRPGKDSG